MSCTRGLEGQRIAIDRLDGTLTDVLVRIENTDGSVRTARLTPSAPSFIVPEQPGPLMVLRAYVGLGVEHILFGVDHLLFVLCLLLLVKSLRQLLATITAFTLAHSITLAAATLGFIHVPTAPVEATIALSIVFLASELVRGEAGRGAVTRSYPWLVAFSFGLLHGLGFAGALAEVGLPQGEIPLALFAFNVGVELGSGVGTTRFRHHSADAGSSCSSHAAALPDVGAGCGWVCDRIGGRILGHGPTCCGSLGLGLVEDEGDLLLAEPRSRCRPYRW